MMQKRHKLIPVLAVLLMFSGCAARPIHPGAANSYDSNAYDALTVAHSVIETTKTDLSVNAFPPSISGNVKTALNDLIRAYDVAQTAYAAYHAAAFAGTATVAQSNTLTAALNDVGSKTTALTSAKAAK